MAKRPLTGRRVRLMSRVTKIVALAVVVDDDVVDAVVALKPKSPLMATRNQVTRTTKTTTTKTCLASVAMTTLSLMKFSRTRRRPLIRVPPALMKRTTTRITRTVKNAAHVAVAVAVASVRMTNLHRSPLQ